MKSLVRTLDYKTKILSHLPNKHKINLIKLLKSNIPNKPSLDLDSRLVYINPQRMVSELCSFRLCFEGKRFSCINPKHYFFIYGDIKKDSVSPIESHSTYIFCREVMNGIDPRKTSLCELLIQNKLEKNYWNEDEKLKKIKTIKELEEYYRQVVKLFESIERYGYQCQGDIRSGPKRPQGYIEDEIGLFLDNMGPIFFRTGHHRLAVLKLLKYNKSVPATIQLFNINFGSLSKDFFWSEEALEDWIRRGGNDWS